MADERRRRSGLIYDRAMPESQQRFHSMLQQYSLGTDALARQPLEQCLKTASRPYA